MIGEPEKSIGNFAFLTFRTKFRGPVLTVLESDLTPNDPKWDIIDESLFYFRPNVFLKSFEIKSSSDRVLIYLTLYIIECLKKLQTAKTKDEASHILTALAITRFDIPGDPGFPLNHVFGKPDSPESCGQYPLIVKSHSDQVSF